MNVTRRSFLTAAATTPLLPATQKIRFGGPIFLKSDDPGALAKEHRRLGYSAGFVTKLDTTIISV